MCNLLNQEKLVLSSFDQHVLKFSTFWARLGPSGSHHSTALNCPVVVSEFRFQPRGSAADQHQPLVCSFLHSDCPQMLLRLGRQRSHGSEWEPIPPAGFLQSLIDPLIHIVFIQSKLPTEGIVSVFYICEHSCVFLFFVAYFHFVEHIYIYIVLIFASLTFILFFCTEEEAAPQVEGNCLF